MKFEVKKRNATFRQVCVHARVVVAYDQMWIISRARKNFAAAGGVCYACCCFVLDTVCGGIPCTAARAGFPWLSSRLRS